MTDPAPSDDLLTVTDPSPDSTPPADPALANRIDAALGELAACGVNFNNFYSLANQNKAFVLAAVRGDEMGERFKNTTAAFKADKDIAIAAVTASWEACEHVAEALWDDRDVVLAAVTTHGNALRHASARLRDDRDVVLAAVKQDGHALAFASEALRGDREVVLTAVNNSGWALRSASEPLQNDEEIVLAAIMQDSESLECAPGAMRQNAAFVERAANALVASGKGYAPYHPDETMARIWQHKTRNEDGSRITHIDMLLEKSLLTPEEKTAILGRLPMTFRPNPEKMVSADGASHNGAGLGGGTPPVPSNGVA